MPYGNINVDTVTTSTSGGVLGAGNASIMKNRIINGAMAINQRGSSTTSNGYALDRWKITAITGSKMTVQQSSDAPTGFSNSMLITSSAATTIASGDYYDIGQLIEGFNTSDLGFGTANAKTVTVSFWAKSSLTGNFGGSLQNQASNRSYPFTYTISAANTWEYKTATIAGDTTGTWIGATNGTGMGLLFGLGIGSTYQATANTWAGGYFFPTSAVNLLATNAATLQITGVQLEVGSSATGYEYRLYNQEFSACQRYYETMGYGLLGIANSATGIWAQMIYKVQKRATPTIGLFTTTQTWGQFGIANRDSTGVSIGDSAKTNAWGSVTRIEGFSSITTNAPLGSLTDTVFTISAEL